ncbi:MAG TPA: polyphenol oxidase family protein [Gaiellaceae bacterium]|nr:polyphenol oxidase family protein [Gaiellaceae bacterium]
MIRWSEPGYVVGFTTRVGGVSGGPFASLNLGRSTGDDVACVDENRRRACAELEAEPSLLALNRQVHSTTVNEASPGVRGQIGDGLWCDRPGVPMLALAADCVPIAVAARGRGRLAVVHAGWRGLSSGVVGAGVSAVRAGEEDVQLAAAIGPSAGPCCYEVGAEVSDLFDADLTRARKLDLWGATERLLRAAGVGLVERVDLCTICRPELFFSHRRDGRPRGVQGVIGYVA